MSSDAGKRSTVSSPSVSEQSRSPSPRRDHQPQPRRASARMAPAAAAASINSPMHRVTRSSLRELDDKENSSIDRSPVMVAKRSLLQVRSRSVSGSRGNLGMKKSLQFSEDAPVHYIPLPDEFAVKHKHEDKARRESAGLTPFRVPLRNMDNDSPVPDDSVISETSDINRAAMYLVNLKSQDTDNITGRNDMGSINSALWNSSPFNSNTPQPASQSSGSRNHSSREFLNKPEYLMREGVSLTRPSLSAHGGRPITPMAVSSPENDAASVSSRSARRVKAIDVSVQCSSACFEETRIHSDSSDESSCADGSECYHFEDPPGYDDDSVGLEDLLGLRSTPFKFNILEEEDAVPACKRHFITDDESTLHSHSDSNSLSAIYTEPRAVDREGDRSVYTEAATCLTLDAEGIESSKDGSAVVVPPRLLIASRTRHRADFEDVKELLFKTTEAATTTILLTFGNQRESDTILRAQAVQMRYENVSGAVAAEGVEEDAFRVWPTALTIPSTGQAVVHVSFTPTQRGVYSGVLKLKCNKRAFTFLLRGENDMYSARPGHQEEVMVTNTLDQRVDEDLHLTSIAMQRNRYIQDWLARSLPVSLPTVVEVPMKPTPVERSAPVSVFPLHPEFAPSPEDSSLYRSLVQLHNSTDATIQVALRSPYRCIELETRSLDIEPHGYVTVKVTYDVKKNTEGWDKMYLVISLSSGFERHIIISSDRVTRTIPSLPTPTDAHHEVMRQYTPPIHHRRLERSLSTVSGLYFKRSTADFGTVLVGSLSRCKVELCNATDAPITVHLADPELPFVLLHNEVILRPRSYVRIPVRFVPISCQAFSTEITVQSQSGLHIIKLKLKGRAAYFEDNI